MFALCERQIICMLEVCVDEQNAREEQEHANSKQRGDCVIEQLENVRLSKQLDTLSEIIIRIKL